MGGGDTNEAVKDLKKKSVSGLVGFLFICLWACTSSRAAESSRQDWQFGTDANPASPTAGTNAAGDAVALIVPGYFSTGWLAELSGFGTQTGLWDLGMQNTDDLSTDSRGLVSLNIPNPLPLDPNGKASTELQVRVVQLLDGFLYKGDLTFSVPGATFAGRTTVESLPPPGGSWVQDEYRWHLTPAPAQVSLVLTGAVGGTVIDRIIVDTITSVPQARDLIITSVEARGQVLALAWQGGVPPYQVEVAKVAGNGAWQQAGPAVSTTSVEVPMDNAVVFVRVRGSN